MFLLLQHADARIGRLESQLRDLRQASAGATPEGLLTKMEEETNVNSYIVTQKLPKELEAKRKNVANLQEVTNQPALGQVRHQICLLTCTSRLYRS